MRKRFISAVLCIVFMLTLFPLAASGAADDKSHAPYDLTAELMNQDETHPYGSTLLTFKINDLPRSDSSAQWFVLIEKRIGASGQWKVSDEVNSAEFLDFYQISAGLYEFEQIWVEDYAWDGNTPVSFRLKVILYDEAFSLTGESGYSNTAAVGVQASGWAVPELQKAEGYGLIPASLEGKDLTQPITREEFCELALLLYEKTTGKTPAPASPNPFTDTQNPQILKAFALGITKGTSPTAFTPTKTVSRQECATMLYRAIRVIAPDADYSIAGVRDFPDQKHIDSWAVEGTKYMFKLGIIKGDARGYFMPKSGVTANEAAGYGTATREAAVLMTVRSYETLDKADGPPASQQNTSGDSAASKSAAGAADFTGNWLAASDNKELKIGLQLTQTGSQVTGYCTDYALVSAVGGAASGNVLTAKLLDKTLVGYEAEITLTLAEGGLSFSGSWKSGDRTWTIQGIKAGEYHGEGEIHVEGGGTAEFP